MSGVYSDIASCDFSVAGFRNWTSAGVTADIEDWQCILLLLCLGAFSLFISLIHRVIRTYIYYDAHLLDTFFDAGGDVNFALVACSLVAKYAWTSVFVIPVVGVYKYGMVGHFWFSAALALQLFLFSIVATEIRIKAPGAKTYLQVIRSRFGTGPHVVLMIFALFLNLVVSGMIMMEATRIIDSVSEGVNKEIICIILALVVGFYSIVGGVGGSIYVAYFMTSLIMAVTLYIVTDVFWNPLGRDDNPFGNIQGLYDRVICAIPNWNNRIDPNTNQYGAMTFVSIDGMIEGAMFLLGGFGLMFVDQSFWQSGVSTKPNHGLWGFLTAGLSWFAIPFCFSYVIGIAYWGFVANSGTKAHLLTEDQAKEGVLTVMVMQELLAGTGSFLIFVIVEAAAITTASGQILAASSIVVYDIYQTYIAPFKSLPLPETKDVSLPMRRAIRTEEYLEYDKRSVVLKHVVVVCLTFLLLAAGVILLSIDINTTWLFFFTAIVVNSCVVPVALGIVWHRIRGAGVIVGVIMGTMGGVISWLVYASTYEGKLSGEAFLVNTLRPYPVITGEAIGLILSGLLCIFISVCCGGCDEQVHEEEVWERTRDIDNPILPWSVKYAPDIKGQGMARGRPHFYTVRRIFQSSEIVAYLLGVLLAVLFILVWPACMLIIDFYDLDIFTIWTWMVLILCIVATTYLSIVPLFWEIIQTCRQAYYNRQWARNDQQRLEEEHSEPDQSTYKQTPTPPPPPGPDNGSESDFQSTMDRNEEDKERWKTFIHLD